MMKCQNVRVRLLGAVLGALWLGVAGVSSAVHADQDETVIVVLGDSLTAGYGLPIEQSFPAQLETALRKRGHKVRVVNVGRYGGGGPAAP